MASTFELFNIRNCSIQALLLLRKESLHAEIVVLLRTHSLCLLACYSNWFKGANDLPLQLNMYCLLVSPFELAKMCLLAWWRAGIELGATDPT
jgi:hypothetical protein